MAKAQRQGVLASKYRLALVSDLDWTMVNHSEAIHEGLLRFNRRWLSDFAADSVLVFSSGRSPQLFRELADEVPLLTPNILVCSVGTEILIDGEPDEEWEEHLNQGWDRKKAADIAAGLPELVLQQPSEQRPHKISYKLHAPSPEAAERTLGTLRERLAAAGLDTNLVYSAGVDVDILPSRASKGKALSFLLQQLEAGPGRPSAGVLVCGDSGNDIELFAVPGVHGCMVANAHPELREWCERHGGERLFKATADGPGGILQAIDHFGFSQRTEQPGGVRHALLSLHETLEAWVNATGPRSAPSALPAVLGRMLASDYEHVTSEGSVLDRQQLLSLHEGRYGCECDFRATAPDPQTQPPNDAPATEEEGGGEVAGGASNQHRYRIWLDQWREREVGPGLWLARYTELHQPFTAGVHTQASRTARCVSVLLRAEGRGGVTVLHSHETRLPGRAHPDATI